MSTHDFDEPLIQATLMLADAVQVADGRLFILGGGLREIGPSPQPLAIAMLLELPWNLAGDAHEWNFELLDEDGSPVFFDDQPLLVRGEWPGGRPEGVPAGTPLSVPMALNFMPLPLEPGKGYLWRLSIDGTSEPEWTLSFRMRPMEGIQDAPGV